MLIQPPLKIIPVDIAVRNIDEIIMNSVKKKKQVSCNSAGENFSDSPETPITVGLGVTCAST